MNISRHYLSKLIGKQISGCVIPLGTTSAKQFLSHVYDNSDKEKTDIIRFSLSGRYQYYQGISNEDRHKMISFTESPVHGPFIEENTQELFEAVIQKHHLRVLLFDLADTAQVAKLGLRLSKVAMSETFNDESHGMFLLVAHSPNTTSDDKPADATQENLKQVEALTLKYDAFLIIADVKHEDPMVFQSKFKEIAEKWFFLHNNTKPPKGNDIA